ncbi:MAG: hypothetical protein WA183_17565 [Chthoniobacterales bacterium]
MDEIESPAAPGGRDNQAIRIGPTLLRHGYSVEELHNLLAELYPGFNERDLRRLVRQSLRYALAGTNRAPVSFDRVKTNSITAAASAKLPSILQGAPAHYGRWADAGLALERRAFLSSLFHGEDLIWIGMITSFGTWHFRTTNEWLAAPTIPGEFISHSTFRAGSTSRSNENVLERKYFVVESDELNHHQVKRVFRYLEDEQGLKLCAIVSTGGRSLHGWFEMPNVDEAALAEWAALLVGLKCDPATLRPSQPVRLPGCIRRDTGRPQELLYLRT